MSVPASGEPCPACGKPIPKSCSALCSDCYWELPGNERAGLIEMARRRQPLEFELARCVRILKERRTAATSNGSELFFRVMKHSDDLMRKVWNGTPWMIEAFTGGHDDARWVEMAAWCEKHCGAEAWPIHGYPGKWHRGGATINGFTWLGFASEEMMKKFQAAWPNP